MSDIKISQLPVTSFITATDLLPISKNIGNGNWESNAITADNLLNSLASTRLLKVAKDGTRDASTIEEAISIAVTMSPIETNPIAISVSPGSYFENNPLNIPQWVTIFTEGGQYSAAIIPNNNGNILVANGNSLVNGLSIIGLSTFSNVGYCSTNPSNSTIENCIIVDCQTGILANGGNITANFITGLSVQKATGRFLSSINGGYIIAMSANITGSNSYIPVYAYYTSGTDSELYLFSCLAENCVNGIYLDDGAYVDSFTCHFESCTNALHIGPIGNGAFNKNVSTITDDGNTFDIKIESPNCTFVMSGGRINSSKFSIIDGVNISIVADDANMDGGLIMGQASLQGKVGIGTPGAITLGKDIQLNIGEGSSFVNDQQGNPIVEYWSYDTTAPSGSKFTRLTNNAGTQLTGANDAIYVGCKYPFPAIRLDIDVAAIVPDYFTTEYWNGTTWVDLTARLPGGGVAAYRRTDFATRSNNPFQNIEIQFVEFSSALFDNGDWSSDYDILDEIPKWDADDVFYAIRFRNIGALATGMQFSNGLVKPHSFMVSTSGKKANFGIYRTEKTICIDSGTLTADPTYPPSRATLQVSTNIGYTNQPSLLKSNNISRVSTAFVVPEDIDTSSPLQCFINGNITTSDIGNIQTNTYRAEIDVIDPPSSIPVPELEVGAKLTQTPGILNGFLTISQNLDVSGLEIGDTLLISFERDAGTNPDDTYLGDFIIGNFTFKYKSKFV